MPKLFSVRLEIVSWCKEMSLRPYLGKRLYGYLWNYLWKKRTVMVSYTYPEQLFLFDLVSKIMAENGMLMSMNEACQIYRAVKATQKMQGDLAEVGVYKGGTSKIICEAKREKKLHLFDTFEGIPSLENINPEQFRKNQYGYTFENVKKYLKNYENVYFYKGVFPSTGEPVKNKKFSFVHLDVDFYESTLNSLIFFYPLMAEGGVIISHDYLYYIGVKKAFDDFFKDKVEPVITLSDNQCMIVKCST